MADQTNERWHSASGLVISTLPQAGVWVLQAATNYALTPFACRSQSANLMIHLVTVAAFAALLILAWIAFRKYKNNPVDATDDEVDAWPPERWMPAASCVLAVTFAFVTLLQAIPPFILGRCQ